MLDDIQLKVVIVYMTLNANSTIKKIPKANFFTDCICYLLELAYYSNLNPHIANSEHHNLYFSKGLKLVTEFQFSSGCTKCSDERLISKNPKKPACSKF